jgi:hypothetical protein
MAKKIMRLGMDEWLLISNVQLAAEAYIAEVECPAPDLLERARLRGLLGEACEALRLYRVRINRGGATSKESNQP